MRVAIVDDEQDMRQSISQWLSLSGFETETYADATEALKHITPDFPGVVVTDVRMPGMDGMGFLKRLMAMDNALPVILITGHGDVPMAVEAMQIGAYGFMEKPFNPERMSELAKRACAQRQLVLDNRALRKELSDGTILHRRFIGTSRVIEQLREDILDLGQADGHVFISGETGTGKNLVAQALHAVGARAGRPFVTVACAAYGDAELFELLWPSDDAEGQGLFEQAKGGSLVLDGIENLPDTVQAKLLEYMDHGASSPLTGPRVIAICNAPDVESCESALRADLFFRLSALRIDLIPLRYRNEDVLPLFTHFIEQWAEEYGCDPLQLDAKEAAQLMQAPWPGNVRQLMNVAERAILQTRRGEGSVMSALNAGLNTAGAADMMPAPVVTGKPLREYIEAFECMLIDNTMRRHRGSVVSVMEELCLPRRTLNEKMAKYGLSRSDYL